MLTKNAEAVWLQRFFFQRGFSPFFMNCLLLI